MRKVLLVLVGLLVFQVSFFQSFAQRSNPIKTGHTPNIKKEKLKVYPNPSSRYISLTSDTYIKELIVYNVMGGSVATFQTDKENEYYVGDFPRGTYLVQLIDHADKVASTLRFRKV